MDAIAQPRRSPSSFSPAGALALAASLLLLAAPVRAEVGAGPAPGTPLRAIGAATVRFDDLAKRERLSMVRGEIAARPMLRPEEGEFQERNAPGEPSAAVTGAQSFFSAPSPILDVASPAASKSFPGLDDIPMVDSMYIIIPPDVSGGVGPTRLFQGSNNDYRVLDKATGATISTVGTATFWAPVVPAANRLDLTDPRTLYDPYNNRWIAVMQTVTTNAGLILVGVSQTSDPAGAWNLYAFATGVTIDFPIVGFNKNWIAVTINRYSGGGTFSRGIALVVDYPSARAGVGTGTIFTQAANSHFCSAPCVTYSATSDTLYVVTHLSSSGATYALDAITGTAGSPVYTAGGSQVRPGGGWAQAGGNQLPQSAPNSGTSACSGAPCPIESQDAQVRSAPVFRDGSIWYAQSVGLPLAALTHVGVQWTQLTTPGGTVVDGGRIEDATATSTNGGKWYSHPHLAVNRNHDFLIGFTQFSSAQHPSVAYASHLAGDAAGSMRDVVVAHAGEDYYHKTFSTTTGRNRWGDFSTVQVDPGDDLALWSLQEYAKSRASTDDGNSGSNASKWGTWWAAVLTPAVSLGSGFSQPEGNSGTSSFTFTVNLTAAYGLPVKVDWHTVDGSATSASGDYVAASSTVTIPAGATSATFSVTVNGDQFCEGDESFGVAITGNDRNLTTTESTADAVITDDDPNASIAASAGTGGSISPSGSVAVTCGQDQAFTITPDAGFTISDLVVDGVSVTPVTTYTFTGVQGPHTISATFGASTAVGDGGAAEFALGAISPNPAHGMMQVSFGLASSGHARVTVLDLQGRERAVLAEGDYGAGWHSARWNGTTPAGEASAGIYFLRYQVAGRTFLKKFARMN